MPSYKRLEYETDRLIDKLSDYQLLSHMGVPEIFWPYIRSVEWMSEVKGWVEDLPFIFRPQPSTFDQETGLCGMGLAFYGDTGTGKSTAAADLLLHVVRKKVPNIDPSGRNWSWRGAAMGRWVDWQDASDLFRRAVKDEEADQEAIALRTAMVPGGPMKERADFLVIDDISRERRTEFNSGELHRVLRRRQVRGFPTIITTNHYPDEWDSVYGEVMGGYLRRAFVPVEFTQVEFS